MTDYKLKIDPEYINKARKSMCKSCGHNGGWGETHYKCDFARDHDLVVAYRPEGVLHTEIYKCNKYSELIEINVVFSDIKTAFVEDLKKIKYSDDLGKDYIGKWLEKNGYEHTIDNLAKCTSVYFKHMFLKRNWRELVYK